jgi:hypothetical protein
MPVKCSLNRKEEAMKIVLTLLALALLLAGTAVARPVEIRLPADKPGSLRFACGMGMVAGTLVLE